MAPHRHERISESIREELEEMIGFELSDPRVSSASVAEIILSPDYRRAYVRLALAGSTEQQEQTLAAIEHAKSFLKQQLSERLQLFRTPELHFEAALAAPLAARAPQILKRIKRGRPRD